MTVRAWAVLVVLATGCASPTKEQAIQTGLTAGVVACDALLADPNVQAEPEAREWCARLVNGCREIEK